MSNYTFTKVVNIIQLKEEIQSSDITVAIEKFSSTDTEITIYFKSDLSTEEEALLASLVNSHVPVDEVEPALIVKLGSPSTKTDQNDPSEEEIPYIYSTSRPLNHYVCFQGSADSPDKIGGGQKCVFRLNSKTDSVSKDFTFNEGVYLKDGYIITRAAPMGASIDIDIVEPQYGMVVGTFARKIPIFGSGWFPLDTEDRGFLPQGLIIRITVNNSNGGEEGFDDDDFPADFYVSGRFELYRPRWPQGEYNR